MERRIAGLTSACLCIFLSACGGGGGQTGVPATGTSSLTSGSAVVFVPDAATGTSQRSRDFISPSASSVAIVVNSAPPVIADISSTSPLCTTVSGGRSCTVPLAAPVGNDTLLITLYSGPNATGSVLGTGSTSTPVVSGQPFTASVTVGGTVASLSLSASGSFTQGTPSAVDLTVSAKDAGGNTIIGATPYSSVITLTDNDTSGSTTLSTTTVTSPATSVTVTYNGGTVSGGMVTISASAPNVPPTTILPAQIAVSSGNACAPLTTTTHLYVANDGAGNALQFAPPYTSAGVSLQSLGNPVAIKLDNQGNLFVAPYGSSGGTSNAGDVLEFAPPYTGAAVATLGAGLFHGPRGIAIDGSRNVFVTDGGNNRVLEFAPPYTAAPTILFNGTNSPYAIALSPNCNLFVTTPNSVVEYPPPYTGAAVATITSGLSSAGGLAFDAAGDLFVADPTANTFHEYTAPYTGAPAVTTTLPGSSVPLGLAVDSSGNLFVNEYGLSAIAEYAAPYTGAPVTTISSGSGLSLPADIGFGP